MDYLLQQYYSKEDSQKTSLDTDLKPAHVLVGFDA
jgi:hypothetical protein